MNSIIYAIEMILISLIKLKTYKIINIHRCTYENIFQF